MVIHDNILELAIDAFGDADGSGANAVLTVQDGKNESHRIYVYKIAELVEVLKATTYQGPMPEAYADFGKCGYNEITRKALEKILRKHSPELAYA